MTGIGSGLAADVSLARAGESPAFGLFLAGLGVGVMVAASLRGERD